MCSGCDAESNVSKKHSRIRNEKFKGIIIILLLEDCVRTYAHAQLFMNFEFVRVHERLRLTDKKDGAVPALAMVSFAGKTSS